MARLPLLLVVGLFLGVILLIMKDTASAVPRYSARYEQNCNLCHTNPTGGGMRSLYASQWIVPEEMALSKPGSEVMSTVEPNVSKSITLGTDFRVQHVYSDDEQNIKNFFQMQGDLYVQFQMGRRLSLYLDKGISQSLELYGLAYILPFTGYVKAGRFVPTYGWKFADHTMFVRDKLDFFPPRHTDVGVEFGIYPKRLALTVGVLNGASGSTFDENNDVAAVGRALYRFNVAGVGVGLGASALHNSRSDGVHRAAGPLGYLSWKDFTWVGEVDWYELDPSGAPARTSFVSSHEVVYAVRQGLHLKGTYDFFDPDWDRKSGKQDRYGAGVVVFINPFASIEILGRQYEFEPGPDVPAEDSYAESVVQVHFLF